MEAVAAAARNGGTDGEACGLADVLGGLRDPLDWLLSRGGALWRLAVGEAMEEDPASRGTAVAAAGGTA